MEKAKGVNFFLRSMDRWQVCFFNLPGVESRLMKIKLRLKEEGKSPTEMTFVCRALTIWPTEMKPPRSVLLCQLVYLEDDAWRYVGTQGTGGGCHFSWYFSNSFFTIHNLKIHSCSASSRPLPPCPEPPWRLGSRQGMCVLYLKMFLHRKSKTKYSTRQPQTISLTCILHQPHISCLQRVSPDPKLARTWENWETTLSWSKEIDTQGLHFSLPLAFKYFNEYQILLFVPRGGYLSFLWLILFLIFKSFPQWGMAIITFVKSQPCLVTGTIF